MEVVHSVQRHLDVATNEVPESLIGHLARRRFGLRQHSEQQSLHRLAFVGRSEGVVHAVEALERQSAAGRELIGDGLGFDLHPMRLLRRAAQASVVVQYSATAFEGFGRTFVAQLRLCAEVELVRAVCWLFADLSQT